MALIDKLQVFWIFVNFYIHLGWELSLFVNFPYLEWDGHALQGPAMGDLTGDPAVTDCRSDDVHADTCTPGWHPYNAFVMAFNAYGEHDKRYRVVPTTHYGSNVDKLVLAVEIPAGILDGILCIIWLYAIMYNKWYRYPIALTVSALHAFGTFVFWGDEIFEGYMSWYTGHGWTWPSTGGPDAGIGFWWAFVGSNAVWVIVPWLVWRNGMTELKKMIKPHYDAVNKTKKTK